ncbi:MAG TPA: metallophosphoesterase [Burkholderiales bacterium]|nr:metallophosphoesterase [Burkholderiales bacterium]
MVSKKILILSDTHFSKNNELLFKKYDVEYSINKLKNKIKKENPDYIFLLGDISQDGSIESYIKIRAFLSQFNCSKYVIMGNHDSGNIKYMLDDKIILNNYLDIQNHRFIFLSSFKGDGFNEGYISETELEKVKKYFNPNMQNYLLIHHHFIIANGIIDNAILENHLYFCKYIAKFDFKAIFHGHVHNAYSSKLGNTIVYANPSTCIQFALKKVLELEPVIGFRILNILKNSYVQKVYLESL